MCDKDSVSYIYKQLVKEGFKADRETEIAAMHLNKKPGENQEALIERMTKIKEFFDDTVGNSILAASYYGMEELRMRLPRLEETLVNPFGTGRKVSFLSAPILMADGGPAEGAKAIQFYLQFMRKGIDLSREDVLRLIGLLCVVSVSPADTVKELSEEVNVDKDISDQYVNAGIKYIENLVQDKEKQESLGFTAQSLLGEMSNEVETILSAILRGNE